MQLNSFSAKAVVKTTSPYPFKLRIMAQPLINQYLKSSRLTFTMSHLTLKLGNSQLKMKVPSLNRSSINQIQLVKLFTLRKLDLKLGKNGQPLLSTIFQIVMISVGSMPLQLPKISQMLLASLSEENGLQFTTFTDQKWVS